MGRGRRRRSRAATAAAAAGASTVTSRPPRSSEHKNRSTACSGTDNIEGAPIGDKQRSGGAILCTVAASGGRVLPQPRTGFRGCIPDDMPVLSPLKISDLPKEVFYTIAARTVTQQAPLPDLPVFSRPVSDLYMGIDESVQQQIGVVASLRRVCRLWRDSIGYDTITTLGLRGGDVGIVLQEGHGGGCGGHGGSLASREAGPLRLPSNFGVTFSRVTVLTLRDMGLLEIPPVCCEMHLLQELYVQENYLTQLPVWLCSDWVDPKRKERHTVARAGLTALDFSNQRSGKLAAWLAAVSMIQATGGWTSVSRKLIQNRQTTQGCTHDSFLHISMLPLTLRELSLAEIGLRRLPKSLEALQALESLDLGRNRRLDVSNDDWIANLPGLKTLSIAHTDATILTVPKWMSRTALAEIDLSNSFSADDEHELDFLDSLSCRSLCDSIVSLELGGVAHTRELPVVLRGLVHLNHLNLMGWCSLEHLPEWLGNLPLEYLGLFLCIELVSLPQSFRYARKPGTELQLIDVRDCYALHGFTGLDTLASTWPRDHEFSALSESQPQLIFRIGESQWLTDRDIVVSPSVPVKLAQSRRAA